MLAIGKAADMTGRETLRYGISCLINCCLLDTTTLVIVIHRCFKARSGIKLRGMIKLVQDVFRSVMLNKVISDVFKF